MYHFCWSEKEAILEFKEHALRASLTMTRYPSIIACLGQLVHWILIGLKKDWLSFCFPRWKYPRDRSTRGYSVLLKVLWQLDRFYFSCSSHNRCHLLFCSLICCLMLIKCESQHLYYWDLSFCSLKNEYYQCYHSVNRRYSSNKYTEWWLV
jgi:hypothetical protein